VRFVGVARHPAQLATIGESVLLLGCAEIALRVASLPRAARWFGATLDLTDAVPGPRSGAVDLSLSERRKLAALARVARHWPFAPNGACLRHSLSAAHVLRSQRPALRLAARTRAPGAFTAHAWTEVRGTAVTDPGAYSPQLRSWRPGPGQAS